MHSPRPSPHAPIRFGLKAEIFFLHFQMKKPRPQVAGFLTVSPHPRENAIVTESGTIMLMGMHIY